MGRPGKRGGAVRLGYVNIDRLKKETLNSPKVASPRRFHQRLEVGRFAGGHVLPSDLSKGGNHTSPTTVQVTAANRKVRGFMRQP